MTSFGRAEASLGGRRLVAEIRSVNHRFLELKLRLGREDAELEAELGRLVRSRLERGAVSLSLREENDQTESAASDTAFIDEARADAWMKTLSNLSRRLGTNETPSLALICAQSGVLRARAAETPRAAFIDAARAATTAALAAMLEAREREGKVLARDLGERLSSLRSLRAHVATLSADEPARHHDKLKERVAQLLDGKAGVALDGPRMAQELALLAEHLDVSEELVRLGAHLDEAARLLDGKGAAGRRLDFLTQEIHREVNTIGSKAQAAEITAKVVDMKVELERFREQVQNVE